MAAATSLIRDPAIMSLGIVAPPEIHIESPVFVGSLATLFQGVRDRKIDLLDIPIAPICEAYLHYLLGISDGDIDSSAVALSALAYLIERKAWMLLPASAEEPSIDDVYEEIDPTVHEYWPAIHHLNQRREERESLFFRSSDQSSLPYELPFEPENVHPADLARALESLLSRAKPDVVTHLSRPRRSLTDQMILVMQVLPLNFLPLDQIVVGEFTRSEVVWWFLALLELIRLGQAAVQILDGEVRFARGGVVA